MRAHAHRMRLASLHIFLIQARAARKRRGSIVNVSSCGSVGRAIQEGCGLAATRPSAISRTMRRRQALTNMSFDLAKELKPRNAAVTVVFPAATRSSGSDEMVAGRKALGIRVGSFLRAEH